MLVFLVVDRWHSLRLWWAHQDWIYSFRLWLAYKCAFTCPRAQNFGYLQNEHGLWWGCMCSTSSPEWLSIKDLQEVECMERWNAIHIQHECWRQFRMKTKFILWPGPIRF